MGDLLALAIVAHGGMQRWDEFKTSRPSFPSPAPSGASSSSRSAHRQDLRDRELVTIPGLLLPAKHSRRLGIRMVACQDRCRRSAPTLVGSIRNIMRMYYFGCFIRQLHETTGVLHRRVRASLCCKAFVRQYGLRAASAAIRRAKFCCDASKSARRLLVPSEVSSSRTRKRVRSGSDGTLGSSSGSIAMFSGSVWPTIITSDRGKGPAPWEGSAGRKRAPCGRLCSLLLFKVVTTGNQFDINVDKLPPKYGALRPLHRL